MKNKTIILLCLLVLSLLFGCSKPAEPVTDDVSVSVTSTTVTTTAKTETTTEKAESTTAATTTTTKKHPNIKVELKTENQDETTVTTKKHTTTKMSSEPKQEVDKSKCQLSVECKAVLNHMDDLADGHAEFVPKSGYILGSTPIKYEDGDTVYSVLKRACRENGIKLTAKMTGYGMYVVGLNNIDEKDCGGTSGWTYYVDGEFPMVACDKYELHGGEKIEFIYVV